MKKINATLSGIVILMIVISPFINGTFPILGESEEWSTIENEFFIVNYHTGSEEDAGDALSAAMWVRDQTMEKYPHTLDIKVTITIYNDREEILLIEGSPTALAHVGSTSASIGILSPSWTGHWGGYESLDNPFRRVLNHEYVHCPFYIDLYTKSTGYKNPQSWFSQGLAEYISANYLPSYENRVRESVEQGIFTFDEPYSWGLYIVEYMYAEYGQDKVVGIIRSSASTFYDALEQELGVTYLEFEDGWKRYLSNKFGVEYSSPETGDNTIELLEDTINQLNIDIENLTVRHEELASENNILMNDYLALQEEYEALEDSYEELDNQGSSIQTDYETLTSQYESLLVEFNSMESQLKSLQSDYDALETELNSSKARGIPGFPYQSIFIGVIIVLWILSKSMKNVI